MAKIRSIKPEFFTSEDVSALPLRARLTWIGLWTHCDDQGRTKDHPRLIKAAIYPLDLDVSLRDVEEDLTVLAEHGRIVRYEVDGTKYLAITNWGKHQYLARPSKPKHPAPPGHSHDTADPLPEHGNDTATTYKEGKGKEGKGGGGDARASSRPDPWCTNHPGGTDTPCRPCATARTRSETWTPPTPTVDDALNPQLDEHGFPAGSCPICRRAGAA